jgi:hypothetical protein
MHRIFLSSALAFCMACTALAQDIAGDWLGTLKAGPQEIHMILHIIKANDGEFTAKLDIIEQNVNGLALSSIAIKDSKLHFLVDAAQAKYEGKIEEGVTSIQGTWSQSNQTFPMDFKRQAAASDQDMARAGQILDLLLQEKYADFFAAFSSELRASAGLTEDKVRTAMREMLSPLGAVQKRFDAQSQGDGDLQIITIPVQFEKGAFDFIITLNRSRQVVHFNLRPGTANSTSGTDSGQGGTR